ncbi:MAG: citrate lyase subunit alpha, partial [Thermoplasmata archaeon]
MVLDAAAKMGIRDLRLAQTALFPVHEPVIEHIKNGVVTAIEGSINGPVGAFISRNAPLKEPVILRSHGGRARAVVEGELPVDVAFIAASECDPMGNCNGVNGPSAFGPMGFAYSDAWGADKVVIVTDNVVKYPAHPISISEIYVDYVVRVPSIGEPQGIASGTTKITTNPVRLEMARTVVDVIDKAGYIKEGFSFQAGAGGTSLAVVKFLHERMKEKGVVGDFAVGGVTEFVVNMLRDGTIRAIIDAQAFDLAAVESLRVDRNHIEVSHYHLMSPTVKSHVVMHQDACFLGATEVDVNFNVNVNTHSDGLLLHGIGGHQDAAAESKITIVVTPIVRKNIPIVREEVTTVSTPGDAVDVIVTDKGIAVNPRREDLMERLSGLNIVDIEDLKKMAYDITGGPPKVKWGDEIIALTQYRDGTYLDTIRSVRE